MKPHAIITIAQENYVFNALRSICIEVKNKSFNDTVIVNLKLNVWGDNYIRIPTDKIRSTEIELDCVRYFSKGHEHIRSILSQCEKLFDYLKTKYNILVFLLADDTGTIEKFAIRYFNSCRIPVVLWGHGCGPLDNFSAARPWLHEYNKELASGSRQSDENTIPVVYPHGFNGRYYLCTNGSRDTTILDLFGFPAHNIRQTGNPHYDRLILDWKNSTPVFKPSNRKTKILFISSGYAKFGMTSLAARFYTFLLSCIPYLPPDKYELFLRLKPGENIAQLNVEWCKQLNQHGVTMVDNSTLVTDNIGNYDIFSTDVSTAMIEALLNRIPCVSLGEHSTPSTPVTLFPLLKIIRPEDADSIMSLALSPEYVLLQDKWIQEREELLFHRLDGMAAGRIADVVLEAVEHKDLVAPSRPFVYPQAFEPEKIWHPNVWIPATADTDADT